MATKETVKKCLAVLAGSKPGTDMTAVSLESYAVALEPVPDAVLEQVAVGLMRASEETVRSWGSPEMALLYLVVFVALVLTGGGRFALERLRPGRRG